MEDFSLDIVIGKGPAARSIRLKLPHFTVVGATTRLALVTSPLRARFGAVYRLDFYDQDALIEIVQRGAGLLDVAYDDQGLLEIASRSRGTPRVALRMLRRVRDYAQVRAEGQINGEVAKAALDLLNIDGQGLDDLDRRVLLCVIEKYDGGPVGLNTIAASVSEGTGYESWTWWNPTCCSLGSWNGPRKAGWPPGLLTTISGWIFATEKPSSRYFKDGPPLNEDN